MTHEAFEKLLARMDADRERAGERYETLRRKLMKFFEWHGIGSPEEHADETINRIARKITEGEEIHDLHGYCYGVARMLLREALRERERERAMRDRLPPPPDAGEEGSERESRVLCLDECLGRIPAESRELILEYYQSEKQAKIESRRELAGRLGIPLNALRIRAHRIRAKLEACVNDCLKQFTGGGK
jgi:RNA polymerase sigma factor (sigma-70 family)